VVSGEPQERGASRLYRLSAREVYERGLWRAASGGVLMRTVAWTTLEYGDLVDVRGTIEEPPRLEAFDYPGYLARQGIRSVIEYPAVELIGQGYGNGVKSELIRFRGDLTRSLERTLPEPESSLAAGILLGARGSLPQDLRSDMDSTGTSHLVAVSGQNITMLAGLVIAALAWLIGRRPACLAALATILAYAALVGGEASVVRATIMAALYIGAIAAGRQNSGWVALVLAAALMTAHEPRVVHDVSFQLSFAAVLGLATIALPIREQMERVVNGNEFAAGFPPVRPGVEILSMSLASVAFTLPITAAHFHQVSLVSPAANLFAVPAFLAVAVTAALAAVVGYVLPGASGFLVWVAWPPAAYMSWVVGVFADVPAASVRLEGIGVWHVLAYYIVLALGLVYLTARRAPVLQPDKAPALLLRPSPSVIGATATIALSALVVWLALRSPGEARLTVTFLDVGQGDAVLVEGPTGNRVLVDGGPSGEAILAALGRNLPFYEDEIDMVVLTHEQADHLGGLPAVLEEYRVGAVIDGGVAGPRLYASWEETLSRTNTRALRPKRGQAVDLGGGASVTVLGPGGAAGETADNRSVVTMVQFGGVSMLLTGDLGEQGEVRLSESGTRMQADVLKLAHHGSATSSSSAFISRVQPRIAVVSVGARNRFGHPTATVLERLAGVPLYRTDEDGDVVVSTDGDNIWVDTGR
jgi:competence protein ComEC